MEADKEGRITLLVEDDGTGIDEESDMMLHYGLPIMKERAERLDGILDISESPSGGTSIRLSFSASDTPPREQHNENRS